MTPFTVHADGIAEIPHHAERALINVVVASSGTNKVMVSEEVMTTSKYVENLLLEYSSKEQTPEAKAASPLAHWSETSLSATSHIPYSNDTKYIPPRRYEARITFDIRFKEFSALGAFGARLSALEHVEVHNIRWVLTAETLKAYKSQLRREAARDALAKVQDYCDVLGCTNIRPVTLNEVGESAVGTRPGLMPTSYQSMQRQGGPAAMGSTMGAISRQPGIERDESPLTFTPQEVRMNMKVTVKFEADPISPTSVPAKRPRTENDSMDEMQ